MVPLLRNGNELFSPPAAAPDLNTSPPLRSRVLVWRLFRTDDVAVVTKNRRKCDILRHEDWDQEVMFSLRIYLDVWYGFLCVVS